MTKRWLDRTAATLVLGGACTLLAQCGGDNPSARAPSVRDSAGVHIVENEPMAIATGAWRLDTIPLVDIGAGEDTTQNLSRVAGAIRLENGDVVVADNGSHSLRWYGNDGRFIRMAGGQGKGPGEFLGIGWMRRGPGDSIVAYDQSQGRLSIFDTKGAHSGDRLLTSSGRSPPPAVAPLDDGSFLAVTYPQTSRDVTGEASFTPILVRYMPDGAMDTIAVTSGIDGRSYIVRSGGFGLNLGTPFDPTPRYAGRGMQIVAGNGETFLIQVYEPGRGLVASHRLQHDAAPVTDAMMEVNRIPTGIGTARGTCSRGKGITSGR
jgi:hypothetical protein